MNGAGFLAFFLAFGAVFVHFLHGKAQEIHAPKTHIPSPKTYNPNECIADGCIGLCQKEKRA